MKILCFYLMLFLSACESKRLIFKSDIILQDNVQFDLRKDLEKFGVLVEGEKLHSDLAKNCIGVLEVNSVLICKKNLNLTVLSFYKITDNNKSMRVEEFKEDNKKGEEKKSYKVHTSIVNELKNKSSNIDDSILSKGDLLAILKEFYD